MTMDEGPGIRGTTNTYRSNGVWARYANALLGAWLFVSAFSWTHTAQSQQNSWIVGMFMFVAAITALFAPAVRFANTVLAVWLLISTMYISHAVSFTVWHNAILAIVVLGLSLVPSFPQRRSTRYSTPGA